MSASLVKKSLELFDDDLSPASGPAKKKMKQKDPMSLISTKKKGVKKQLKKLHKPNPQKQSSKQKWSAIERYRHSQPEDYTEASVRALQKLSQVNKTDKKTSKCILDHHLDKKSRKLITPTEKQKEIVTAFTDKDFEDFAKEFDFSNIK